MWQTGPPPPAELGLYWIVYCGKVTITEVTSSTQKWDDYCGIGDERELDNTKITHYMRANIPIGP